MLKYFDGYIIYSYSSEVMKLTQAVNREFCMQNSNIYITQEDQKDRDCYE